MNQSFCHCFVEFGFSLNNGNFPPLNFKPLEMKCFEYILNGQDVIGVLPTGFGKSMLFHLLPHCIHVKTTKNIVIVVCPLNSIIKDQLKVLKPRGITADVLQLAVKEKKPAKNLFGNEHPQAREKTLGTRLVVQSPIKLNYFETGPTVFVLIREDQRLQPFADVEAKAAHSPQLF